MRFQSTVAILSGLLVASPASAAPSNRQGSGGKCKSQLGGAVYLTTNGQANYVVSLGVEKNGMLSKGKMVATGGCGSASISSATNMSATADPLVGQSALTVAGQNLFAVNAGTSDVSMFSIDGADPTKLVMVGMPAKVPGEFLNTVAASAKHKIVCAAATGAIAGVSCAPFDETSGIGAMDALRPIDLGQTTPPVGPTNTVSQVLFSEDQNTLFAIVKGDPGTPGKTGFVAAFPVTAAQGNTAASVSAQGKQSSPDNTLVLFGTTILPGTTDLFATDASFGAAVLSVAADGTTTTKARGVVDGQAATCWTTFSPATKTAFVTDVLVNRLVEMSVEDASILRVLDLSANKQSGMIDLRAMGSMVYALAPGNNETATAVVVVDAKAGKQVQVMDLGAMGVTGRAQGMAIMEL
ncbi:uncharacterized protein B0I36DRAFT_436502 [Microdochium trichocladiopsis]|uniref:3-carboxymuconate cyclase n=1 Tax=Microdochium trichocladiopsis TaxID=1682393 RepID=A0A9P9BIN6_9PEZI|nr:uncharacterized protein B0I36DRAFT_436502 [Microdochium trichocladiopsis]KAH7014568.1 hypothetical protein B0I36DRAFT_436502 [Microdochium trichocladiopsis]